MGGIFQPRDVHCQDVLADSALGDHRLGDKRSRERPVARPAAPKMVTMSAAAYADVEMAAVRAEAKAPLYFCVTNFGHHASCETGGKIWEEALGGGAAWGRLGGRPWSQNPGSREVREKYRNATYHGMVCPLCPPGRKREDPLRTGFTKECYARWLPTLIGVASKEKRESAYLCSIRIPV